MVGNVLNQNAATAYCKSFTAEILEQRLPANSAITGQQILDITPNKQVNFFVLKVLFLKWQSETQKFRSPYFDYSQHEVKQALKSLVNTLSRNILIKREDFRPLLEEAVGDTIQLMFNPAEFFIREFSALPGVSRIPGFRNLSKYVKVRRECFNSIIEKLDADGSHTITDDEIKSVVTLALGRIQWNNAQIEPEIRALESILPLDIFEKEGHRAAEKKYDFITSEIKDSSSTIEKEKAKQRTARTTPSQHVTTTMPPEVDKQKQVSTATLNEQYKEEKATLNQQFEENKRPASIAELHEKGKISEIQKSISVNQRYMFLNDLFNGDAAVYNEALREVENSNSFDDSVELLVRDYSKQYAWDMNSHEVKELLKVIFKRFR